MKAQLKIFNPKLGTAFPMPAYETQGSGAMDLRAVIDAPITIAGGEQVLIPVGFGLFLGDPGYAAIVCSRSGLSLKNNIRVAQGTGLIDSDYQNEIGVILQNYGKTEYQVNPGDRIAQLMIQKIEQVQYDVVSTFSEVTARGEGGFGSTGTK